MEGVRGEAVERNQIAVCKKTAKMTIFNTYTRQTVGFQIGKQVVVTGALMDCFIQIKWIRGSLSLWGERSSLLDTAQAVLAARFRWRGPSRVLGGPELRWLVGRTLGSRWGNWDLVLENITKKQKWQECEASRGERQSWTNWKSAQKEHLCVGFIDGRYLPPPCLCLLACLHVNRYGRLGFGFFPPQKLHNTMAKH